MIDITVNAITITLSASSNNPDESITIKDYNTKVYDAESINTPKLLDTDVEFLTQEVIAKGVKFVEEGDYDDINDLYYPKWYLRLVDSSPIEYNISVDSWTDEIIKVYFIMNCDRRNIMEYADKPKVYSK
jgi:hypothetical protein